MTTPFITIPEKTEVINHPKKGKNVALILLWIIGISIGFIFLVSIISYAVYASNLDPSDGVIDATPQCSDLISGLPDISDDPFCPGQGNTKYNSDINVIMGPTVVGYQSVCKEFCSGDYDTETDICSNDTQTNIDLVNNCLAAMRPVDCIGQALPLAISDGTTYYGNRASITRC